MTPSAFKQKWAKFTGKESAAYQEHFNDLCRMLGVKTPVEADPTGDKEFCFQKRVAKDAELFDFDAAGNALPASHERGFADVWKADCFGWEYKGPREDLEKAYKQLLRYRESLLNPPLLIVCDFHRYIVRTNFNGAVQETHTFTNENVDSPDALRVLRAAFTNPDELRPRETTANVTERLAKQIAEIALSLQMREAVELENAKTRRQHYVGQKQNLRIARFLNRLVFCFFAEDTELLPKGIFAEVCQIGKQDPQHFAESLEDLFRSMAKGGRFGTHKIRHFNGHLFEDATVFELTLDEIEKLAAASAANWQNIRPAIMGTLFERALDDRQRSQLGAHYTSEEDITTLVEPVLMAPLRREWTAIRRDMAKAIVKGKGTAADRDKLASFQARLAAITVLDPACGSGNFLYVALQLLLGMEKEVIAIASSLGLTFAPQVSVQQLRAIELNAYAYELAQVSVQIGYLQWRRDNGFDNDRTPVLQDLAGFENKDALLNETFRKKPKNLKAAQAEEHGIQDELFKVYTERAWPASEVIVGNPPFVGDKKMRRKLGDRYVDELREIFKGRVTGQSDLFCYWFEKARQQIEDGNCQRAGLLSSQAIRGSANRPCLEKIKQSGGIFFAVSDRNWILDGATVHVSLVGFDNGSEMNCVLDGIKVEEISSDLKSAKASASAAKVLKANEGLAFIGTMKKGKFELTEETAIEFLSLPNPNGRPSSDVVRPWIIGKDITGRSLRRWLIDFPFEWTEQAAAGYEKPFETIRAAVFQKRVGHREGVQSKFWWRLARSCPDLRKAIQPLSRYLVTPAVSKQRFFTWADLATVPDQQVVTFASEEDSFAGILESRFHRLWLRRKGNQLREAESASRYNVTECFLTFPFPSPTPMQATAIATAAKELNDLRERWLNPPEWTVTSTLNFSGSVHGPWARYVDEATVNPITQMGMVRYPRIEPREAESVAKLSKRTLTNLYNERPAWLGLAHAKLDAAVGAAYGWPANLDDESILERMLALNLTRAAEEAKTAPSATKPKAQRAKQADEML